MSVRRGGGGERARGGHDAQITFRDSSGGKTSRVSRRRPRAYHRASPPFPPHYPDNLIIVSLTGAAVTTVMSRGSQRPIMIASSARRQTADDFFRLWPCRLRGASRPKEAELGGDGRGGALSCFVDSKRPRKIPLSVPLLLLLFSFFFSSFFSCEYSLSRNLRRARSRESARCSSYKLFSHSSRAGRGWSREEDCNYIISSSRVEISPAIRRNRYVLGVDDEEGGVGWETCYEEREDSHPNFHCLRLWHGDATDDVFTPFVLSRTTDSRQFSHRKCERRRGGDTEARLSALSAAIIFPCKRRGISVTYES